MLTIDEILEARLHPVQQIKGRARCPLADRAIKKRDLWTKQSAASRQAHPGMSFKERLAFEMKKYE